MKTNCRSSFEMQISFIYDLALKNLQFEAIVTKNVQKRKQEPGKQRKRRREYVRIIKITWRTYQIEMNNKNLSYVYVYGRENTKTLFELTFEHPY